jgi:hypothetical protein
MNVNKTEHGRILEFFGQKNLLNMLTESHRRVLSQNRMGSPTFVNRNSTPWRAGTQHRCFPRAGRWPRGGAALPAPRRDVPKWRHARRCCLARVGRQMMMMIIIPLPSRQHAAVARAGPVADGRRSRPGPRAVRSWLAVGCCSSASPPCAARPSSGRRRVASCSPRRVSCSPGCSSFTCWLVRASHCIDL